MSYIVSRKIFNVSILLSSYLTFGSVQAQEFRPKYECLSVEKEVLDQRMKISKENSKSDKSYLERLMELTDICGSKRKCSYAREFSGSYMSPNGDLDGGIFKLSFWKGKFIVDLIDFAGDGYSLKLTYKNKELQTLKFIKNGEETQKDQETALRLRDLLIESVYKSALKEIKTHKRFCDWKE